MENNTMEVPMPKRNPSNPSIATETLHSLMSRFSETAHEFGLEPYSHEFLVAVEDLAESIHEPTETVLAILMDMMGPKERQFQSPTIERRRVSVKIFFRFLVMAERSSPDGYLVGIAERSGIPIEELEQLAQNQVVGCTLH